MLASSSFHDILKMFAYLVAESLAERLKGSDSATKFFSWPKHVIPLLF